MTCLWNKASMLLQLVEKIFKVRAGEGKEVITEKERSYRAYEDGV